MQRRGYNDDYDDGNDNNNNNKMDDHPAASKRQKISTEDAIAEASTSASASASPPAASESQSPQPRSSPRLYSPLQSPSDPPIPLTAEQVAAAAEAAQDAADAPLQAENGIAFDTDPSTNGDPFSDDGYETDSNLSASTSLASSVYNYAYENGRRYHKFREGTYNFPNDDAEQEREDMKHGMVVNLCQVLHFAPVKTMQ